MRGKENMNQTMEKVEGIWGMTYRTELDFGRTIENRVFNADLWIVTNDEQWMEASSGHWQMTDGSFPSLKLAKAYLTRQIRNNRGCGFPVPQFRIVATPQGRFEV